jgi:hypothetical protein
MALSNSLPRFARDVHPATTAERGKRNFQIPTGKYEGNEKYENCR